MLIRYAPKHVDVEDLVPVIEAVPGRTSEANTRVVEQDSDLNKMDTRHTDKISKSSQIITHHNTSHHQNQNQNRSTTHLAPSLVYSIAESDDLLEDTDVGGNDEYVRFTDDRGYLRACFAKTCLIYVCDSDFEANSMTMKCSVSMRLHMMMRDRGCNAGIRGDRERIGEG